MHYYHTTSVMVGARWFDIWLSGFTSTANERHAPLPYHSAAYSDHHCHPLLRWVRHTYTTQRRVSLMLRSSDAGRLILSCDAPRQIWHSSYFIILLHLLCTCWFVASWLLLVMIQSPSHRYQQQLLAGVSQPSSVASFVRLIAACHHHRWHQHHHQLLYHNRNIIIIIRIIIDVQQLNGLLIKVYPSVCSAKYDLVLWHESIMYGPTSAACNCRCMLHCMNLLW